MAKFIDYPALFHQVVAALAPWRPLWSQEVMENFPQSLDHYPQEFLADLHQLTMPQLWQLEQDPFQLPLGSPLKNFFARLFEIANSLEQIDLPFRCCYPDKHLRHVRGKKQHEIRRLGAFLGKLHQQEQFSHGVDIGGGQGHLARTLADHHQLPIFSLDKNEQLQELGRKRQRQGPHQGQEETSQLQFVKLDFHHHHRDLGRFFTARACTIGLHTCGPLALSHFESSLRYGTCYNLNFGCCYLLLDAASEVNLSQTAKRSGLTLTPFALSLATRSHAPSSWKNFLLNRQVKYYRYGLHLAFTNLLNLPYIRTVGDCPARIYHRPFADYFFTKCQELGICLPTAFTKKTITDFFHATYTQQTLGKMYLANTLRWRLGRALEIYLLLDRVLWLQEHQCEVTLAAFFQEALSPRNLGIIWRPTSQ